MDLSKIFEDAGYYLSKSKKESAVKAKEKQDKGKQEFTSLMECNGVRLTMRLFSKWQLVNDKLVSILH